jgi:hypothetical protein
VGKGFSLLGLVFDVYGGSDKTSSLPSAVKLKLVLIVPNGIKEIGESSLAVVAMRQPAGI